MVEALVERDERAVHARLDEVVGVFLETHQLYPLDDALVRPHQHVCAETNETRVCLLWGEQVRSNSSHHILSTMNPDTSKLLSRQFPQVFIESRTLPRFPRFLVGQETCPLGEVSEFVCGAEFYHSAFLFGSTAQNFPIEMQRRHPTLLLSHAQSLTCANLCVFVQAFPLQTASLHTQEFPGISLTISCKIFQFVSHSFSMAHKQ